MGWRGYEVQDEGGMGKGFPLMAAPGHETRVLLHA